MTVPDERTRAIVETKRFLDTLVNPMATPRVPAAVRETAQWLLRHYPTALDLQCAHDALPDIFGPVPRVVWPTRRNKNDDAG